MRTATLKAVATILDGDRMRATLVHPGYLLITAPDGAEWTVNHDGDSWEIQGFEVDRPHTQGFDPATIGGLSVARDETDPMTIAIDIIAIIEGE